MSEGIDPDLLIADMMERRILAWANDHTVRTIDSGTLFAGFEPSGEGFTTTDSDLLSPWISRELDKRKPR